MDPNHRPRISQLFVLTTLAVFVGCGGNETPPKASAEQSAADSDEASATDGGGISLPDVDAPAPGSGSKPPAAGSGTIELPDEIPAEQPKTGGSAAEGGDFELPEIDQSSRSDSAMELKYAAWAEIRKQAQSTGKVTVVDLWSTMCEPCVKEFPGLVKLDKTMRKKVTCIGVSVDFDGRKKYPPESYQPTVQAFLTAVGATFDNYICQTPSDDVFKEAGLPSIPAVLVFDAEGKLVKQFIDAGETIGFTYDKDVIPLVNSIL